MSIRHVENTFYQLTLSPTCHWDPECQRLRPLVASWHGSCPGSAAPTACKRWRKHHRSCSICQVWCPQTQNSAMHGTIWGLKSWWGSLMQLCTGNDALVGKTSFSIKAYFVFQMITSLYKIKTVLVYIHFIRQESINNNAHGKPLL